MCILLLLLVSFCYLIYRTTYCVLCAIPSWRETHTLFIWCWSWSAANQLVHMLFLSLYWGIYGKGNQLVAVMGIMQSVPCAKCLRAIPLLSGISSEECTWGDQGFLYWRKKKKQYFYLQVDCSLFPWLYICGRKKWNFVLMML